MKKFAFLLLFVTALLASCTKSPQLSPLPRDAVILAFGDSLTYGTGAGENESYPAVLEKTLGKRVINAGVPGEVSATGLQRLPGLLEQHKPALLILCHGGNDLLQKLDQKALADNLRAMVRLAADKGVPVVMLAVPSPGLSLSPPPLYEEVAAELAVPLDLKSLSKILGRNALKSDYIHPNAAGYKLLAENIFKLLRKSGALP
jgi:lysophospholipase L1-like esterase